MKRIGMVFGVAAALSAVALAEPVAVDGVAAYVNDSFVTVGEVREAMAPLVPELRDIYQGAELHGKIRETYNDVLQSLIEDKLIVRAYEADAKLNKEAMTRHVERRVNEFIEERFGGDRQEFLKALKDEHMPYEEWHRRMRDRLIVGMMRQKEVESQVVIPPREVRRIYEENAAKYQRPERVRVSVIVIRGGTNETNRADKLKVAVETLAQLQAGASFAETARRVSEEPKAQEGGDWGWLDTADLRRELAEAVRPLGFGKLSGVLSVDGDLYLVKLVGRQVAGVTPFDEARTAIEKDLRRKEAKRLHKVWIDRLRKDAYIQIVKTDSQ